MSYPTATEARAERRIVAILIILTLCLSCLPCALGYFITPPGMRFIGTAYNIDDYCNYFSWLRQTMDGHFFLHNQFTTDPQKDLEFNLFFWLLGRLATVAHLSPQAALQCARVGGGAALLLIIYRFYRAVLPGDLRARLTAFGFACLSGGFGWVNWTRWHDKNLPGSPVDAWQPEAFTFLTLYTNALMTVSTALIVLALYALLRGEQTGQWKYAVLAGACGAILGNMHSYDVLHLAAAWGLFLVVWSVLQHGRGVGRSWTRGLLAFALTLPTTAYQYFVFQREAVFHARANTPTLSPAFIHYVDGYGLVFVLACVAVVLRRKSDAPPPSVTLNSFRDTLIVICWAIGGLLVIYLPVAFQRKMVMGTHVPLCLLAGIGAVTLLRMLRVPARWQNLALVVTVALSTPSTFLFLARDMTHLTANRSETQQTPFLPVTLVDTYAWLREHTPRDASVAGFPYLCAALPGYAGRTVWAGHWAETPSYGSKVALFTHMMDADTSPAERTAFLRASHVNYLFYPPGLGGHTYCDKNGVVHPYVTINNLQQPGMTPVYRNKNFVVFHITP